MKRIKNIFIVLLLFWLGIGAVAGAAEAIKLYLPGDYVNLIVEAPVDTAQITAVMPDQKVISLVHEEESSTWRAIWQVPLGIGKGLFTARLKAVDLDGNIFEGRSAPFQLGEKEMIMLVGETTREAKPTVPLLAQRIIMTSEVAGVAKVVVSPIVNASPVFTAGQKAKLIEQNMVAGKSSLVLGRLSEAAAYFRVVLYLDPQLKTAGVFLAETQIKIAREDSRRRQANIMLSVAGLFVAGALLFFVLRLLNRKGQPFSQPAAKISEEQWCNRAGLKKNPFSQEIVAELFNSDQKIDMAGLKTFIKARIKDSGGAGMGPFTETALETIFRLSGGIVSQALMICEWSIDQAIRKGVEVIDAELVKQYEQVAPRVILIADDEEVVRASLDAVLRKGGGYQTEFAVDGEETLEKVRNRNYSALLLDISMPKIDGYGVLRRIREMNNDLPVIFVTGQGKAEKVLESMAKDDLSAYLEKPFTPQKVLSIVAKNIKRA